MTEELASNKEQLERSNRELTASNQRLADERALIAAVLENVAAGVVSIDSQGRIFTCNGAALDMLRQREEDVVGRPFEEAWGGSRPQARWRRPCARWGAAGTAARRST